MYSVAGVRAFHQGRTVGDVLRAYVVLQEDPPESVYSLTKSPPNMLSTLENISIEFKASVGVLLRSSVVYAKTS